MTVTVLGGTLSITGSATGTGADFSGLAGIQLVTSAVPAAPMWAMVLLASLLILVGARRLRCAR